MQRVEFAFVCVGTPPRPDGTPDMRQVHSVTESLAHSVPSGAHPVVIHKSTMPIGTGQWMHTTLNTLGRRTGAPLLRVARRRCSPRLSCHWPRPPTGRWVDGASRARSEAKLVRCTLPGHPPSFLSTCQNVPTESPCV